MYFSPNKISYFFEVQVKSVCFLCLNESFMFGSPWPIHNHSQTSIALPALMMSVKKCCLAIVVLLPNREGPPLTLSVCLGASPDSVCLSGEPPLTLSVCLSVWGASPDSVCLGASPDSVCLSVCLSGGLP